MARGGWSKDWFALIPGDIACSRENAAVALSGMAVAQWAAGKEVPKTIALGVYITRSEHAFEQYKTLTVFARRTDVPSTDWLGACATAPAWLEIAAAAMGAALKAGGPLTNGRLRADQIRRASGILHSPAFGLARVWLS